MTIPSNPSGVVERKTQKAGRGRGSSTGCRGASDASPRQGHENLGPATRPLTKKRRSVWRQRLVDAERGMSQGVRMNSTFYGHFFVGSIVLATAAVLSISLIEWAVLLMALTLVLAAEMFNQVLKAIWHSVGHHFAEPARSALRMGTAAVFVTILGATLAIGLIFGRRLIAILGG